MRADLLVFDNSAFAECPEANKLQKTTRLPPNLALPTFFAWFGKVYSRVLGYPWPNAVSRADEPQGGFENSTIPEYPES